MGEEGGTAGGPYLAAAWGVEKERRIQSNPPFLLCKKRRRRDNVASAWLSGVGAEATWEQRLPERRWLEVGDE